MNFTAIDFETANEKGRRNPWEGAGRRKNQWTWKEPKNRTKHRTGKAFEILDGGVEGRKEGTGKVCRQKKNQQKVQKTSCRDCSILRNIPASGKISTKHQDHLPGCGTGGLYCGEHQSRGALSFRRWEHHKEGGGKQNPDPLSEI